MWLLSLAPPLQFIQLVLKEMNSALHTWWELSQSTDLSWGGWGGVSELLELRTQDQGTGSRGIENHLLPTYQQVPLFMFGSILVFLSIWRWSLFNINARSRIEPGPLMRMCLNVCYLWLLSCVLFTSEAEYSDMWPQSLLIAAEHKMCWRTSPEKHIIIRFKGP